MLIAKKLTIDLVNRPLQGAIYAVQCDSNTRAVEVTLTADGVPWQPPEGTAVSVAFKKPDGNKGWYDQLPNGESACWVSGNVVTAILAPEVLTAPGRVNAAIVFQDGNMNQLSTFGFAIDVEPNPAAGKVISNSYYKYSTMEDVNAAMELLDNTIAEIERAKAAGEFKGEKGDKGDKGDKGETGAQGPQGEKGEAPDAVLYTQQALTPEQQAQARGNIGASQVFDPSAYSLPVVYFDGDTTGMSKDNKVTLNYRYGNRSGSCTLKWQGSSSIAYPKKNYTVVFDTAFEAVEGWGEQSKYCLKADWIDFSHCRNVVTAKLWGQIVKSRATSDLTARLSALPNGGAIDGFPCLVVINGKWQGIYNFNIPKEGWMMGMGSGEKEAILCGENASLGNTFCAEAVIGTDFALEYNSDNFTESQIQDSFNTLVRAVMNTDGTDIDTTIAQYLDIDSAIDYYILTAIAKAIDITAKNAIYATYDGVKWFMSAYDLDSTWGLWWDGSHIEDAANADEFANLSFYRTTAKNDIFKMLYTYKKAQIISRYKELRKSILSPSSISSLFRNYAKNIPCAVFTEENKLWTGRPSAGVSNVEQILGWYGERIAFIDAEIAEMEEKLEQVATEGLAYAEHGHPVFGKMYQITGIGTATDPDVVIPKWINDAPVVGIGNDAFMGNTNIISVEIPEGITTVPPRCFYGATNLTSVALPSTISTIALSAFNATGLTELTIPNSVTEIPSYMAYNCGELASIKIGNRVTSILGNAFGACKKLTTIRLPGALKFIGDGAFRDCQGITEINLPNSVNTIGKFAFSRLFALTSLTIPKNVKTIDADAFAQCWGLETVTFKGTPESIGENAFMDMDGNIYVPWAEGEVAGAPWGATNATIHYNSET